jgi:hypothetical protein
MGSTKRLGRWIGMRMGESGGEWWVISRNENNEVYCLGLYSYVIYNRLVGLELTEGDDMIRGGRGKHYALYAMFLSLPMGTPFAAFIIISTCIQTINWSVSTFLIHSDQAYPATHIAFWSNYPLSAPPEHRRGPGLLYLSLITTCITATEK